MRFGLMVVVLTCVLAACEVRNGTYFVVDGDTAGIEFDKVEFFLGKDSFGDVLYTPKRMFNAAYVGPDERVRLKKRTYAESDVQDAPGATSLTFYLPPDTQNLFPHYAMVVASRGGDAVGIGEVELFNVFDDAAYIYDVALVPVPVDGSFERWGTEPESNEKACVRWTRLRGDDDQVSTYAVVREFDRDCDGELTGVECDDLNYCVPDAINGTVSCAPRDIGCIAAEKCDLGTCIDPRPGMTTTKTCIANTCLPEALCRGNDECKEDGPADEFFACALEIGMTHTEVPMPVRTVPDGPLCMHSFVVRPPAGLTCLNPDIAFPLLGRVGDWKFRVDQSSVTPDACEFTLGGPSLDATPPAETHLVVSLDLANMPGKRTSFVIGFTANKSAGCTTSPVVPPPLLGQPNPTCP